MLYFFEQDPKEDDNLIFSLYLIFLRGIAIAIVVAKNNMNDT